MEMRRDGNDRFKAPLLVLFLPMFLTRQTIDMMTTIAVQGRIEIEQHRVAKTRRLLLIICSMQCKGDIRCNLDFTLVLAMMSLKVCHSLRC